MSNPTSVSGASDRSRSLIAALPSLLLGLGILLSALIGGGPWYIVLPWRLYLGIALELLPAVVIIAGGATALWRRLPDWGYTWLGAALMLLAGEIKNLSENLDDLSQTAYLAIPELSPNSLPARIRREEAYHKTEEW